MPDIIEINKNGGCLLYTVCSFRPFARAMGQIISLAVVYLAGGGGNKGKGMVCL